MKQFRSRSDCSFCKLYTDKLNNTDQDQTALQQATLIRINLLFQQAMQITIRLLLCKHYRSGTDCSFSKQYRSRSDCSSDFMKKYGLLSLNHPYYLLTWRTKSSVLLTCMGCICLYDRLSCKMFGYMYLNNCVFKVYQHIS